MDIRLDQTTQQDHLIARLRRLPFVPAMDSFFLSKGYLFLIGFLTLASNAFGLELLTYGCFIALGIYISFFGKDYLPLIPIVFSCYIAPSIENNPGNNPQSIFYPEHGGMILYTMGALFAVSIVIRLVLDPELGQRNFLTAKRKLLPGILALGCSYLLAGAFSGHYFDHGMGNLVFAILQFAAVALLYYFLCGAVKWEEAPTDFFGYTGMLMGSILLVEVLIVYLTVDPVVNGDIERNLFYTGWGNYNNMGAMLAMMIPFPFYLAATKRYSWIYNIYAALMLACVVLTFSRTSMVFAAFIYLVCTVLLCLKTPNRKSFWITNIVIFGTILVLAIVKYYNVLLSFLEILTIVRSVFSRFDGYEEGIAQFLSAPVFGAGFYATQYALEEWSSVEAFTSFFPARWHNTVIQLAASCGIAGLAAYGWHRLQTIKLLIKKPTIENIFIAASIAVLLLTTQTPRRIR